MKTRKIRFIYRVPQGDYLIQERNILGIWKNITYLAHGIEENYSDKYPAVLLSNIISEKWHTTKNQIQIIEYPQLTYHS